MKQERRISRKALVRRFITTCTIVGVISLIIGIIIGMLIGSRNNITAEAAVYRVTDGPGADIHITLNATEAAETETIAPIDESTVTVIETPEETVSEPETSVSETQYTEPETTAAPTKAVNLSSSDEQLLLKIAMSEAEDQSTVGKALVMRVVLNRVASSAWPNTISDVIYQKGQFEVISNGRFNRVTPNQSCYEALEMVENGWDESQNAQYFCMTGSSKWHENHLTRLFTNGSHTFYK